MQQLEPATDVEDNLYVYVGTFFDCNMEWACRLVTVQPVKYPASRLVLRFVESYGGNNMYRVYIKGTHWRIPE